MGSKLSRTSATGNDSARAIASKDHHPLGVDADAEHENWRLGELLEKVEMKRE
jgi:hypothetical protein